LDAVVLERIVRRRDHHARVRAERAREEGDPGRRQRAHQEDVDAHRADARRHRRLQHVAREPRVLPDEDAMAMGRALADVGERAPQPERRLRRHGLDVRGPAHAVGAEQPPHLPHHGAPGSFGATTTRTVSGWRAVTSSGAGRSTCTGSGCDPGPRPAASTNTAPAGSPQSCSRRCGPCTVTSTFSGVTFAPSPLRSAIGTRGNSRDIRISSKRTLTRTRSGTRFTKSPAASRIAVRSSVLVSPSRSTGLVLTSFIASSVLAGPGPPALSGAGWGLAAP